MPATVTQKRPAPSFAFVVRSDPRLENRAQASSPTPPVDVVEDAAGWRLIFEIPGADSRRLAIEIRGRLVQVRGEKRPTELGSGRFVRLERDAGTFERSIELEGDPDPDGALAELSEGLLTLTLPRRSRTIRRTIPIQKGSVKPNDGGRS